MCTREAWPSRMSIVPAGVAPTALEFLWWPLPRFRPAFAGLHRGLTCGRASGAWRVGVPDDMGITRHSRSFADKPGHPLFLVRGIGDFESAGFADCLKCGLRRPSQTREHQRRHHRRSPNARPAMNADRLAQLYFFSKAVGHYANVIVVSVSGFAWSGHEHKKILAVSGLINVFPSLSS